jgi:hypothetical protein
MANPPGPKRRGFEDEPESALRGLIREDEEETSQSESGSRVERRPFPDLLRTTPAAPLGLLEKYVLGVAAIIVAILFAMSLWKMTARPVAAAKGVSSVPVAPSP